MKRFGDAVRPTIIELLPFQGILFVFVTPRQFVDDLAASDLLSDADVDEVRMAVESQSSSDSRALADDLIRRSKLTDYQADAFLRGEYRQLSFGEYVVLDKLGQGGMGVVLRARHRRMDRDVAVKFLPAEALEDEQAVSRFHNEVRAAAKLTHPRIVSAYDAGEHEGMHYLVMEYVVGRDLAKVVRERGPLVESEAIRLVLQAADGLRYAHDQGLIHRDIKPHNLLLDEQGSVKVLDMGLARFEQRQTDQEALTKSNQIMGTVDYMSPEQAMDTRHADAQSDIYSLGCTLFFFVTGRTPYAGETLMERLVAHRESPLPSALELGARISVGLDRVIQRMMAKSPQDRFTSMAEVATAIESLESREARTATYVADDSAGWDSGAPSPEGSPPKKEQVAVSRRRVMTWVALSVVMLAAAILIFALPAWTRSQKGKREADDRGGQARPTTPVSREGGPPVWKSGRADLLSAINPARDNSRQSGKGKAYFDGDTLVLPPNTHLAFRYSFPADYRLELLIERKSSLEEPLTIILAPEGAIVGVVVGAANGLGGYESGLEPMNGPQIHPGTRKVANAPIIQPGKRHRLHITKRKKRILVTVDDQAVIDWSEGFEPFRSETVVRSMVMTAMRTELRIHRAEIVDLTEQASD